MSRNRRGDSSRRQQSPNVDSSSSSTRSVSTDAKSGAPVHQQTSSTLSGTTQQQQPLTSVGGSGGAGVAGSGMLSSIGSTIVDGMAFGTGSAIAHRAVGAIAGALSGGNSNSSRSQPVETKSSSTALGSTTGTTIQLNNMKEPCSMDKQMYYECLGQNKGDQNSCQFLFEQLKQCQMGQNQIQFGGA